MVPQEQKSSSTAHPATVHQAIKNVKFVVESAGRSIPDGHGGQGSLHLSIFTAVPPAFKLPGFGPF